MGEANGGFLDGEEKSSNTLGVFPSLGIVQEQHGGDLSGHTIQVLPSESNYRRLSQMHHQPRPTIDELLAGRRKTMDEEGTSVVKTAGEALKLGWINGVLIRVLLSIWGTMLFLRLNITMGQSGLIEGLTIITLCNFVTIITSLSMAAVATNGHVESGGVYYMISRALGPEFGGAIGILFFVGNSLSAGLTALGFCLSLQDFLMDMDENFQGILPGSTRTDYKNDLRLTGSVTLVLLLILAIVGMKWITRIQKVLFIMLIVAQLDIFVGSFFPMGTLFITDGAERHAKGFTGWNMDTLSANIFSEYTEYQGVQQSFTAVFAVFINSVLGIVAGANMSGDLKDPSYAISVGTITGIFITYITYAGFAVMICFTFLRRASGNIEEYLYDSMVNVTGTNNITLPDIGDCSAAANAIREQVGLSIDGCNGLFGSSADQKAMTYISATGYLVYIGCFGATLSSSIACIEGAPRVLQAVGKDKIYPYIHFFGKGRGSNDEPFRGYIFTFIIAIGAVMIADLNQIGYLTSNFTVAAYGLMNFSVFHSSMSKSPGWRPAFKYYSPWVALIGAIACMVLILIFNWIYGVVTIACMAILYAITVYIKPDVNWGSSKDALTYMSALNTSIALTNQKDHVKTYRPQILVMSGNPAHRQPLVDFSNLVTMKTSLLVCGNITDLDNKESPELRKAIEEWLINHKIKGFYASVAGQSFSESTSNLLSLAGLGKLRPNIMIMGFHQMKNNPGRTNEYFEAVVNAFEAKVAVGILRLPSGAHFSTITNSINEKDDFKDVVNDIEMFRSGKKTGTIDIWWLFDDGGLTILIPYLIKNRKLYSGCKLRLFALTNNEQNLDEGKRSLVTLLKKFRIDISDIEMIPDITRQPKAETIEEFESILEENPDKSTTDEIKEFNLQKTVRHLRTAELLREHSKSAELVVVTLPMPNRQNLSPVYYMAWLEIITRQMPPTLLIRGNQTSVLTFYS